MGTCGEGLDVSLEGRTRSRFRHFLVADCTCGLCCVGNRENLKSFKAGGGSMFNWVPDGAGLSKKL